MTTLTIRGYPKRVELSSEGIGVYNIVRYEMGAPEVEGEDLPLGREMCVDSVTFNIVAKSRAELARHISVLHRCLREAVSFYRATTRVPCYLECLVPEQNEPVWAAIESFTFHELNDPYDGTNGRIIQDAVLGFRREPWSNIPPQANPLLLTNAAGEDIKDERTIRIRTAHIVTPEEEVYGIPYQTDPGELLFLANGFRLAPINALAGTTTLGETNQQPGVFTTPYNFGGVYAEEGFIRFFAGSAGANAAVFSSLFFNLSTPLTMTSHYDINDVSVDYYAGEGNWVPFDRDKTTWLFDISRTGQSYIGWEPLAVGTEVWVKTTIAGQNGYFVRVTLTPSVLVLPGIDLHEQGDGLVAAPSNPYIDIAPVGGDLPTKLLMRFYGLSPYSYLDSWTGTDMFQYSPIHMNSLMIASARIDDQATVNNDPGPGFYNLSDQGQYEFTAWPPAEVYTTLRAQISRVTQVDTETLPTVFHTFATLKVPARPGVYRAFLRYRRKPGEFPVGTMSVRIAAQPASVAENFPAGRVMTTGEYGIDISNSFNGMTWCLADLGAITLAPDNLRMTRHMNYEVELMVQGKRSGQTTGWMLFSDIILLPVNESFCMFEGMRGPIPINHEWSADTGWREGLADTLVQTLAEESMTLTNIEPGTASGFIGRDRHVGFEGPGGWVSQGHETSLSESLLKLGAGNLYLETDYARRFYFLWYKRMDEGIVWATDQYFTAVEVFGAKQYLTLPAR